MTTRVISDPSALGWEFNPDSGRWDWKGDSDCPDNGGGGGSTQVEFLLNCEGAADGSQDIVDASGNHNIAIYNDVYVSTSEKKYGTGSLDFTKGDGYVSIGHSPYLTANQDINVPYTKTFAEGIPFTIEGWFNFDGTLATGNILSHDRPRSTTHQLNRGWQIYYSSSQNLVWGISHDGYNAGPNLVIRAVLEANKWHHFAATWDGSTYRLFVDGVMGDFYESDQPIMSCNNSSIVVGARLNSANPNNFSGITTPFSGYIDDLMVTNGVCKYTDDFTPPDQQVMALRSANTSKTVVRKVDLEITDPEDEEQSE